MILVPGLVVYVAAAVLPLDPIALPPWLNSIPPGKNIIIHNNCPFNIWPGYVGMNSLTGQDLWGPAGNST